MKMVEATTQNWLKTAHDIIVNQRICNAYVIPDTGIVIVAKAGVVDEQLCYDMGYKVYEAFNLKAGVIVANAGDIETGHFGKPEDGWVHRYIDALMEWLCDKGLNVSYEGNDILVDGYKVASVCVTKYDSICYTGGHIGINTKLEDIKKICTKPMVKIPKGLSEYGITTEEVKDWFLDFCRKEEIE